MCSINYVKFTLNESNFYHMPAPNLNYSNIQTPTPNPNQSPNTEPLNTVDFFPLDEISGYHICYIFCQSENDTRWQTALHAFVKLWIGIWKSDPQKKKNIPTL